MSQQEMIVQVVEELEKDPALVTYIYNIICDYTTYQKGELNEEV